MDNERGTKRVVNKSDIMILNVLCFCKPGRERLALKTHCAASVPGLDHLQFMSVIKIPFLLQHSEHVPSDFSLEKMVLFRFLIHQ